MRRSVLLPVLLGAAIVSGASWAAGPDAGPPSAPPAARDNARRVTLDDLFARLAASGDEVEAKGVANLIERRLSRSGSDTADLLMSRAGAALEAKDAALAVELLDRVTTLTPGWAEAWSRRATAFYLLEDPTAAMADLRQALAHEPRLYDAWAMLGHIEMASGDQKHALEAYRHALALHPFLHGMREMVERLSPEVEGRDL